MIKTIICAFTILLSLNGYSQMSSILYQDESVKVSFKAVDDQYGYIIEDHYGVFAGVLVSYSIDDDQFLINELDTMIMIDSMVFDNPFSYKKDSVLLSFTYRVNEFSTSKIR